MSTYSDLQVMPYHKLMSYLALVIIVSVVSTEVAKFLLRRHSINFAQEIQAATSQLWSRSVDGSLLEKESFEQHIDYPEERTLPCFGDELVNLLQFTLFSRSTADLSAVCKKYFEWEALHKKGNIEAADKFFMESMEISAISAKFYNHNKGSLSIKILKVVEPRLPIWIRDTMHNSSYRWFKDMAMLCVKVILYYADMAKDILLTYQMWILAGFTLYIQGKMFDDDHEPDIARQFTVNLIIIVLLSMIFTETINFLVLINHPHFRLMGKGKWLLLILTPAAKGYILYVEAKLKIKMDEILESIINLVKPSPKSVQTKMETINRQKLQEAEAMLMRYAIVNNYYCTYSE